jgi:ABC-type antimicrobial peptide transport system permease subunit
LRQRQRQVDQLRLFLHLVGLLALFIGGVGIINTMQVMLRRRQIEIAMLKAAGYRQGDLNALFGLEAALLGIMGGVIGAGAGVGASYLVRAVMARAFFLDLAVILDPLTIASGVVVGLVTALIFGLLPIVRASGERPLAVLREAPEGADQRPWLASAGLLILLSLLFVGFAAAILGDPLIAALTVYGGALIVVGLGLCFGLLIVAIARLPVYERPRWRMSLWVFGALGACGAALVAAGVLAALGRIALRALGSGIPGIVALILLGGLGIILVGCASVYALATVGNALMMFAPRAWKTAVMLAYRNLGRQRVRTTTTLTALFVGVFGIGMVVVLGQGIKDAVRTTLADALRYNAFVLAPPVESAAIQSVLDQQHVVAVTGSITRIQPISLPGQSDPPTVLRILSATANGSTISSIEGFDLQHDTPLITLKAGTNLSADDVGSNRVVVASRLMDAPLSLRVGDVIGVQSADGSVKRDLVIAGFYDSRAAAGNPNFGAVLADNGIVDDLGGAQRLTIFSMKLTPQTVAPLRRQMNQTVPAAILFSIVDISALIDQIINNLVLMLTTIASLAMLAGLIIIANAVALAMLERRREIGILKSVGHTSASVLATILIENGLIGLLGALVAMLLVTGAIIALSTLILKLALGVGAGLIAAIIAATVAVTMLVALLVAWSATRIRPIEVLRYE